MQFNLHPEIQLSLVRDGLSLSTLAIGLLSCLGLQVGPAFGQQVWPSFNDTNGPTIEIETEDNVRCRYSSGAKPSFSVAGLSSNPNSNQQVNIGSSGGNSVSSQLGGGLLLTIPFGGPQVEGCTRLSALQESRSKLALGAALLDQGLINQQQFQALGAAIARELGIPAASSTAMPAKPVYEPPPPLNLAPVPARRSEQPPSRPLHSGGKAAKTSPQAKQSIPSPRPAQDPAPPPR
jgi:hypothetical protein